jgi:hypothetical protein
MRRNHALQFGVGELREIDDPDAVVVRRFTPAASGLQPEDGGRHRLRAVGRGLPEQELGAGDVVFRHPVARHRFDLTAVELIRSVRCPRHYFRSRRSGGPKVWGRCSTTCSSRAEARM